MSVVGLFDATLAGALVPSAKTTVRLPPPETTWFAVRIVPVSVTIVPEPSAPFEVVIRTTEPTTCL